MWVSALRTESQAWVVSIVAQPFLFSRQLAKIVWGFLAGQHLDDSRVRRNRIRLGDL